MAFDRGKFRSWIGRLIWAPLAKDDQRDPVQMVILRHIKSELGRWPVLRESDEEHLNMVASEVDNVAQMHADGLTGLQQFAVFAYADPHEASRGQFAFRLEGYREEQVDVSEPPTMEGITLQLMRHNEALMRMAVQGFGGAMNQQARIIDAQGNNLDRIMARRTQEIEINEQALSLKHEREMQALAAKNADERITKSLDRVWTLAPALINRINQKKIVPEDLSIGEQLLVQLAKGITQKQLEQLRHILTPEQAFIMQEMIEKAMDANERGSKSGETK